MQQTPLLKLPMIMPSQAQKHVTHNEALMLVDAVAQLAVIDRFLATPPVSPTEGDRYIVPPSAVGEWTGRETEVAVWTDGAWRYLEPNSGWRCWAEGDNAELVFDGSAWIDAATASLSLHDLAGIGINGAYDVGAPLAVHGPSSLFTGSAGHRMKINKPVASDTASLLFQTGYSGRAELGTTGADDFRVKVSSDGSVWKEALVIGPSGGVTFPNTILPPPAPNLLINPSMLVNQRGFVGGSLSANTYGYDRWKAGAAGASVSAAYGLITLTSGEISQAIEPEAFGIPSFAGTTVTLSLSGLSGGSLLTTIGVAGVVLTPSSDRQSATFAVSGGHTGALWLKLAPVGPAVNFRDIKLEVGGAATAFQLTPFSQDELLCFRYFWRIRGQIPLFLYAQAIANYFFNSLATPVTMRTTPTVTRTLGAYGNLYGGSTANASADGISANCIRLSIRAHAAGECYANFNDVQCSAEL